MGRSLGLTGVIASIVTLSAMGVSVARNATWRDCELAARGRDRSIAACSKLLNRRSSRAHAATFHLRELTFAAKGKLDQAISDISAAIRLDPQRAQRGQRYPRQAKYQQAIVGDGRQSGTSGSLAILNASPEAAVGAGLALLHKGERVRSDLKRRRADILISDAELAERRRTIKVPEPVSQTPWQEIRRQHVDPLASGTVFEMAVKYRHVVERCGTPRDNH